MQKAKSSRGISNKFNHSQDLPPKILIEQEEKTQAPTTHSPTKRSYPTQPNTSPKKGYMMDLNTTKANDFTKQLESKQKELRTKIDKVCGCISLFNLLQSSNNQLRCVQHNNILTLYCLTERKVLCVSCSFGEAKHKTHKVIPLKDSNKYISEDNMLLKEIISNDLKVVDESIRNCQQNVLALEKQLKASFEELEKDFVRKIEELKGAYDQEKERLTKSYSKLIQKSKYIERQVEQFRLKIWQTLSKINIGRKRENEMNENDVFKQVLCSNLAELTRFEVKKIDKKQMDKIAHRSKFA